MRPSRIGVLGVAVVLLGAARPAHATINLTGHWNLKIDAVGSGRSSRRGTSRRAE
jgi:hypothetical protein